MTETQAEDQPWSQQLALQMTSVLHAILQHPFVSGLADGALDPAAFGYYLAQDAKYLHSYARALAAVAAKAPDPADTATIAGHAAGAIQAELALHSVLLPQLQLDPSLVVATAAAPTTLAYTSYLIATTHNGSFLDGLAAVLPCYWIYAEVGDFLGERGSPDARYQRWIDTYASANFRTVVAEVLAIVDRAGTTAGSTEKAHAETHTAVTTRYEWMFWDAAYRSETWPAALTKIAEPSRRTLPGSSPRSAR